jgi:hypothetical protein
MINLRGPEIVIVINLRVIVGDTIARYRRLHTRRQEQHEAPNQGECHNGGDFGIRFNVELDEHPNPFERMLPHVRGAYFVGPQGIHFYFQGTNVLAKIPVSILATRRHFFFTSLAMALKNAQIEGIRPRCQID